MRNAHISEMRSNNIYLLHNLFNSSAQCKTDYSNVQRIRLRRCKVEMLGGGKNLGEVQRSSLSNIRDTSRSLAYFKNSLFDYYLNLLEQIYNPDNPRTFKSVCVKCHSTRSLDSL